MQSGLAVIFTKKGGIPEIVLEGETGFLLPFGNANELTFAMTNLINNPVTRQKMGEAGKKRFEDFFTLKKFEEKLIGIFKEVNHIAQVINRVLSRKICSIEMHA